MRATIAYVPLRGDEALLLQQLLENFASQVSLDLRGPPAVSPLGRQVQMLYDRMRGTSMRLTA